MVLPKAGSLLVYLAATLVLLLGFSRSVVYANLDLRQTNTSDHGRSTILLVSIALRGHAQPLLNIAEELATRGHTVKFASYSEAEGWLSNADVQVTVTKLYIYITPTRI